MKIEQVNCMYVLQSPFMKCKIFNNNKINLREDIYRKNAQNRTSRKIHESLQHSVRWLCKGQSHEIFYFLTFYFLSEPLIFLIERPSMLKSDIKISKFYHSCSNSLNSSFQLCYSPLENCFNVIFLQLFSIGFSIILSFFVFLLYTVKQVFTSSDRLLFVAFIYTVNAIRSPIKVCGVLTP